MYKYCKESLDFKKIRTFRIIILLIAIILFSSFTSYLITVNTRTVDSESKYEQMVMVLNQHENSRFTPQHLYDYIKELNMKHPDIVFAQAVLESGNFESSIFRTNHNLFGMKEAGRRIRTCKGTESNHAYYDNWKQSVLDYAFYQASYLGDIKTHEQYLQYLDNNYAEVVDYRTRVIQVIKNNNYKIKK